MITLQLSNGLTIIPSHFTATEPNSFAVKHLTEYLEQDSFYATLNNEDKTILKNMISVNGIPMKYFIGFYEKLNS
mgnify:FL=1